MERERLYHSGTLGWVQEFLKNNYKSCVKSIPNITATVLHTAGRPKEWFMVCKVPQMTSSKVLVIIDFMTCSAKYKSSMFGMRDSNIMVDYTQIRERFARLT